MVMEGDLTWDGEHTIYRWCIIEVYHWNLYNFINQCHSNKFNFKKGKKTFYFMLLEIMLYWISSYIWLFSRNKHVLDFNKFYRWYWLYYFETNIFSIVSFFFFIFLWLKYVKCHPDQCGSVGWASYHRVKSHWFNSRSGHMPGLRVSFPSEHVRETMDWWFSHTSVFLSLSFSLPPYL